LALREGFSAFPKPYYAAYPGGVGMRRPNIILILILAPLLVSSTLYNDRVRIDGEYSYTYGDSESIVEAKNICYAMAVRNAIEGYKVFVSSTTSVRNTAFLNDLVQMISSGYLEDLTVLEEKIEGRNVYYRVEAFVNSNVFEETLKREIRRNTEGGDYTVIAENKIITVLNVKAKVARDGSNQVSVVYKQKIPYKPTEIMIDWLDGDGIPIGGDKIFTENRLRQNELRAVSFYIPNEAVSYKVWLRE
tara:strand:+ start:137 stop:877 length:741 start_codon:yes stop_codon:yes gene_type:complete